MPSIAWRPSSAPSIWCHISWAVVPSIWLNGGGTPAEPPPPRSARWVSIAVSPSIDARLAFMWIVPLARSAEPAWRPPSSWESL